MSLLGVFKHLLPQTPVWRLSHGKTLTKIFQGLTGSLGDANEHVDGMHETLDPANTGEIPTFETQFGLWGSGTETERRKSLTSAWSETGGQSPQYLQDVVRAAGFDVYLYQWWTADPSFKQAQCGQPHARCGEAKALCSEHAFQHFRRNPHDYVIQPLIGAVLCGENGTSGTPVAQCNRHEALCSNQLRNDPGYIVNMTLVDNVPPPIPDDPDRWVYFLYWAGSSFPTRATVPASREIEFKRLLLKICPTRDWLVLLVDFEP